MTKITLTNDDGEISVETKSDAVNANELVNMFGCLMMLATYQYDTVCEYLMSDSFGNK